MFSPRSALTRRSCAALFAVLCLIPLQLAALTAGEWLAEQQRADGALVSVNPKATVFQATAEGVRALAIDGGAQHAAISPALAFLASETADDNEYLARQAIARAETGGDSSPLIATLLSRQNADGGFGDSDDHLSTVLATAYVLEALTVGGQALAPAAQNAFSYLLAHQQQDGGWRAGPDASSVFLTAQVLAALVPYQYVYDIDTPVQAAIDWLLAQVDALGSAGETFETAAVLLALGPWVPDSTLLEPLADYLRAAQLADGSWGGDVFSTALALRALAVFDAGPGPDPTLGQVAGLVTDAVSGLPLAGVTVTATGAGSYSATTDNTGHYVISGITPGAVALATDYAGYLPSGADGFVFAGQIMRHNVQLVRDPQPVPVNIAGRVVDGSGRAIADVQVSLLDSGLAAYSGADGGFVLSGLVPGTLRLQISKTGYASRLYLLSAPAGGTIELGDIDLQAENPGASTGTVSGEVRDSLTGSPLRGVAISVTGSESRVVYTGTDGRYRIDNVPAGTLSLTASLTDYQSASVIAELAGGTVLTFDIRLLASGNPGQVSLTGTVVDDADGTVLSAVLIDVASMGLTTQTGVDGAFQINGIAPGNHDVTISLPGYNPVTYTFNAPDGGYIDFGTVRLASDAPVAGNHAPGFISTMPANAVVGQYFTYTAVATDVDGDPLIYGLLEYPAGMNINPVTGMIEWIPTLQQLGSQTVTLLVSDGRGGVSRQTESVSVADDGSRTVVVTDLQTLAGITRDAVVPPYYSLASLHAHASDQVWSSPACVLGISPDGNDVAVAAAALDGRAVQASGGQELVFDLGSAFQSVTVFPKLDQLPVPQEGIEYTVWGTNDPDAVFPDDWHVATLVNIYSRGYSEDASCAGDEPDDYAGLYAFAGDAFRYVRILADNSITIFDSPLRETWASLGDDSGDPGWQSANAEIDAVGGMSCNSPAVADAGPALLGQTGVALHFNASASQGDIVHYAWDIDSDGEIDVAGENAEWVFTAGYDDEATLYVVDAEGCVSSDTTGVIVDIEFPKPDLVVSDVSSAGISTDLTTLSVSGSITAQVTNRGLVAALDAPLVTVFEDSNRNSLYEPGLDNLLGSVSLPTGLARDESTSIEVEVNGVVAFRDAPISVMVDSNVLIAESDEDNNTATSADACHFEPPVIGTVTPVKKWHWNTEKVMTIPLTAPLRDTNGDGVINDLDDIAVIFASHTGWVDHSRARLRAVDGKTGEELWSVLDPALNTEGSAHPAVGDIDGDGVPEVVMYLHAGGVAAINADGSLKWARSYPPRDHYYNYDAIALADLDGDGSAEILIRNHVLNTDGSLRWTAQDVWNHTVTPVAVDMDMDGQQEVLIGDRAYTSDGQAFWPLKWRPSYTAFGNFDQDPNPELVVVHHNRVALYDNDGSVIWDLEMPGSGGGAPTIADMDNDGKPEIGVAGRSYYVVFNDNGSVLWKSPIRDFSSQVTGSTVFDFDGDGSAEVIYADEEYLRVYRGNNGSLLYRISVGSYTASEYPVVADIDSDGHAELLVVGDRGSYGLRVYEDVNDSWMNTRKIWNQYQYHVDNINDDLSIPRQVTPSWLTHNTFRLNTFPDRNPMASIDLTVALLRVVDNGADAPATLVVRVGNGGTKTLNTTTALHFYEGSPEQGGRLIGSVDVADIPAGGYQDIELTGISDLAGNADIYAVIDPDKRVAECSEANNRVVLPVLPQTSSGQIEVMTGAPVYEPDAAVRLQASITNPSGVAGEFNTRLQVEDLQGTVMFTATPPVANPVPGGATTAIVADWNSAGVLAGSYRLRGLLYGVDGTLLAEDTVEFLLEHPAADGPEATIRVTTDQPVYHTSGPVRLDSLVNNLTATTLIQDAAVQLTVIDPSAQTIHAATLSLGQLVPGAQRTVINTLVLDGAATGSYSVQASLVDRSRGRLIDNATSSFVVQDNPQQSLSAAIELSAPSIIRGETQTCSSSFANSGTLAWTGQAMRTVLVRLDDETVIDTQNFTVDIGAGGTAAHATEHSTGALEPAFYACILQTQLDSEWTTLAHASFEVIVPPILIEATLLQGNRGRLLALIDNLSAASGCPAPVELGLSLPFATTLPADATIDVRLLDAGNNVVDSEAATLLDTSFPINASVSAVAEDLMITGFNADSVALTLSRADTQPLAAGYRMQVTVTDSGGSRVYASDTLAFPCNPPLAVGDNSGDFQVATLVLPPENTSADPHGPDQAPSTDHQQQHLEDLLTAAGWSYTIATDADTFTQELRSGGYSVYAMLSEQVKLDEDVQKELREAVFRGDGLVLAGSHDNRNHTVFEALGVKLHGVLQDADGISISTADLAPAGGLPLAYPDSVRRIELQGASAAGAFTQSQDGSSVPHPDGHAAAATFTYGTGRSVFIGFDLLAHAATTTLDSAYGELLLKALTRVHPATLDSTAGRTVPVELVLNNQGIATPGEVAVSLNNGSVIDAGAAERLTPTSLKWMFDLALDASATLTFYLHLPADGSDVDINAAISTGVAPDLVPYEVQSLSVVSGAFPTQANVTDALAPLAADKQADKGYSQALQAYERGQTALTGGDLNKALSDWLTATDRLAAIDEAAAKAIRTTLDALIRELEAQL